MSDRGVRPTGISRDRGLALAAQGWTRRFVGGPPRLQEMVELYSSIGQEVLMEPLDDSDLGHECQGCTLALSMFRVVYTRVSR